MIKGMAKDILKIKNRIRLWEDNLLMDKSNKVYVGSTMDLIMMVNLLIVYLMVEVNCLIKMEKCYSKEITNMDYF